MPGLIESHAHLTFPSAVGHIDPSFNPPLDVSFFHHIEGIEAELARAERNAAILLDAGFTSAYSAGSLLPMPVEVILRDKIRAGAVRGPRLRAASAERDNHPLRPDGHFAADWQGPDACRQYVIENAAQGFDSVKFLLSNDDVFVEGGSQITQYSWEEAQAAGEQARESGVWLNCHAQSAESVKLAVRAGSGPSTTAPTPTRRPSTCSSRSRTRSSSRPPPASSTPTCTRARSTGSTGRRRRRWARSPRSRR